jgi:HPt (histidine-containing phosphotransfer) domain-containing protein
MTAQEQGRIDESRLDRLLVLAGPDTGAELLLRLDQDLARIATALAEAIAQDDRAKIRTETHILISVAGTVGALSLSDDARSLNLAARNAEAALPSPLIHSIPRDLATLRAVVARRRAA